MTLLPRIGKMIWLTEAVSSFLLCKETMEREKLIEMLKHSSKVVGSKQVLKGISDGTVRCVIVASDADADLRRKIVASASVHGVKVERLPSKRHLGEMSGIEVAAAVVGLTEAKAID